MAMSGVGSIAVLNLDFSSSLSESPRHGQTAVLLDFYGTPSLAELCSGTFRPEIRDGVIFTVKSSAC